MTNLHSSRPRHVCNPYVERDKKSFEDRFVNNAMSNYQLPYVEEGDEQDEVKEDWSKDFFTKSKYVWAWKGCNL